MDLREIKVGSYLMPIDLAVLQIYKTLKSDDSKAGDNKTKNIQSISQHAFGDHWILLMTFFMGHVAPAEYFRLLHRMAADMWEFLSNIS